MVDFWVINRVRWTWLCYFTSICVEKVYKEKRVQRTLFPCILFFHNEHDMIKCAIANTNWSSANAARSDQVRHQVLDTIWSWRNHQVQTQPDLIKQPAEHDLIRKWVQWTRFPCILFFTTNTTNRHSQPALDTIWSSSDAARATCWGSDKKTSSLNSVSMYGKRVHWTRFLCFVPRQFSSKSSPADSNCYKWN